MATGPKITYGGDGPFGAFYSREGSLQNINAFSKADPLLYGQSSFADSDFSSYRPSIRSSEALRKSSQPSVVTSEPARKKVETIKNDFTSYEQNMQNAMSKLSDSDGDEEEGEKSTLEKYLDEIERIQSGNFNYSRGEKQQFETLKANARNMELRQSRVNANYQGAVAGLSSRTGRARYATELAQDEMNMALQTGVDAINELDIQKQQAINELEEAVKNNRIQQINQKYGIIMQIEKQQSDAVAEMNKQMMDYMKLYNDIENDKLTSKSKDYLFSKTEAGSGFNQWERSRANYRPVSSGSSGLTAVDKEIAAIYGTSGGGTSSSSTSISFTD